MQGQSVPVDGQVRREAWGPNTADSHAFGVPATGACGDNGLLLLVCQAALMAHWMAQMMGGQEGHAGEAEVPAPQNPAQ